MIFFKNMKKKLLLFHFIGFLNILEENEDVQAVSSNFDVTDEVLASLTA